MPRRKKIKATAHIAALTPISDLKPHPRNYRGHPPDQIEHIRASIEANGFYRNVVVAKDDTILAGHGVVQTCKELKIDEVPVVKLPIASDSPAAIKILTGDNAISGLAFDDDRILTNLLKELADEGSLLGTGYDESQLAALLMVTRSASEIESYDAAAEWVGMPEYEGGEVKIQLVISFPSEDERDRFIEEKEIEVDMRGTKYAWRTRWPFTERIDRSSVRFESA